MKNTQSLQLFERANRVIPGGVNSPVRAFKGVEGDPPFIQRGKGPRMWDVDGNEFIDYIMSWGPLILGHAHPEILEAISRAAELGTSFGATTVREIELAERICDALPSVEAVRLVSSGTEATMSALRLARGATGRDLIVKFSGCYHGHADFLLVSAGSGAATLGVPDSAGVPASVAALTLIAEFNDLDSVRKLFDAHGANIAAIIVEPVAGNMGVVPPNDGFLEGLRSLCDTSGALLIFDEVMTGFRVAWGGYQILGNHTPDLTCLGKVIGGGLPAAAFGGRADLMKQMAPTGPVYQAGTLSGNPLAVAAGLKTLELLADGSAYETLEARAAQLATGLAAAAPKATVQRVGSMVTLFFNPRPVQTWADADACDRAQFGRFHRQMLENGVFLPPSQFEAWFVSAAHTQADIELTLEAAGSALAAL